MSNVFVAAAFDEETKNVQFKSTDGRILVRSGGTLCWRTNNCGNLASPTVGGVPTPKKTKSYIGFARVLNPEEHYFFIFPSYEEGREQLRISLNRKHADKNIPELVEKYASKHENNSKNYTGFLLNKTGLSATVLVKDMSGADLETLIDAIIEMEGYHGMVDTRKETWVTVSEFGTSDGAKPIPGAKIKLIQDGNSKELVADENGKFPPIVHPKKGAPPIDIEVPTDDGFWKKIISLTDGSKPKTGLFLLDVLSLTASTLAHKAPTGAIDKKIPVHYRVKPGDSLEGIAKNYRSTPEEIKKLNHLKSNDIHPEKMLWIHGIGGERSKSKATKSAHSESKKKESRSAAKSISTDLKQKNEPSKTEEEHPVSNDSGKSTGDWLDWLNPATANLGRSKEGSGAPLAITSVEDRRVPWMKYVIDEAKRFHGLKETEIEKTINYALEVKTGRKVLVGNANPWCAAFANWCLKQAGYPTDAGTVWAGRANAFVQHTTDGVNPNAPYNPLFKIIDEPIYGAIAVEGKPNRGYHVGFVYGIDGDSITMLGGNQGDSINCIPESKNKLWFLVPVAYAEQAIKDAKNGKLQKISSVVANKELGISPENAPNIHGAISTR